MAPENLTDRCIESISKHGHLRHTLKNGSDQEQRNILTAWYVGYSEAQGSTGEVPITMNVDNFLKEVLPEVRKAAA